jgi:hypothetical protein
MTLGARLLTGFSLGRGFASHRAPSKKLPPTLSLDHFLQRSRVLALYRTILRGTKNIQDTQTRDETRKFARDEFERHRGVTDIVSPKSPVLLFLLKWGFLLFIFIFRIPSNGFP